ncbi:AEC family transporter [Paenibacillus sp.]|uniref:AEC family transporter n=1 Tax=Paenibacillus sp. TaxID=58172 RepID=UPI002D2AC9C0|nr:AEC family transporter [Paenibacillus sp.]HZG58617.1 AEC family transporter [Paenibacillus sp.]
MTVFTHILLHNVIPLSIMIGLGVALQRAFRLDIRTLSKLNFYFFSPAILFTLLYESTFTAHIAFQVLLFFVVFYTSLLAVVELFIRLRRLKGGMPTAMRNSVIFYNSANFAIPLNQLVFAGNPFTMSIQLIIMVIQSLLPSTLGIYTINAQRMSMSEALKVVFTFPAIYVVPIALLLKGFAVPIPQPIYTPLEYIAQAFIATALLTLGTQLGNMKWSLGKLDLLFLSNGLRLLVSPALGFLVVWLLGYEGLLAQALVLSCAVPTSLSSVLLAVEFDNEPDFASQTVFASTVFSIFTVTLVIALVQGL